MNENEFGINHSEQSDDYWHPVAPPESELGDREVLLLGNHLQSKRIALLITGSIAALKAPLLARELRREGADVVAFVSQEALRYTTRESLEWSTTNPVITQLTAAAEHLSDDRPFDAYLVAPATYNTINKMRYGIADGVITSTLASALGRQEKGKTKIAIAPTMHGSLHNSIFSESIAKLQEYGVKIIPPNVAYGKHNLPNLRAIVVQISRLLSHSSLTHIPIIVTGGPTPVPIDNVRHITNKFRGTLSIKIAEELYLRGASVRLILGIGGDTPPSYLPHISVKNYQEYRDRLLQQLAETNATCGIFSAAVADYQPDRIFPGKLPSGGELRSINLVPTAKVIQQVRQQFPKLYMVAFKYQENVSHEHLIAIARHRCQQGYNAVVANRGEETGDRGEQIAYWVSPEGPEIKAIGKPEIARTIADRLEESLT
ncbi:bifunctional phosphopantothenoylcysteine decarboxylase/phosphopantothenate--cysteine ligase CoaBC [Roseofilum casamattae]|uniref:Coenzyme A biosynthesis bifunctional protein CoaBC n=1 Tax=Roseofilum casamattae BLCC-M143 TaxID=3022442 RepID=A0ABT7C0E5_9CYAN|nr:bifunctional phosphopantothenoylcysteine decarboxylase/phosphopantothenate--cysteine ligase CoaBC [Roseofilum casamattae]MDJ1184920.1 bifunctional phosphopantothenoylcysteine decarboxylase/phosphopantothenate--cysteine ligase CoaBC [Roseofilum casamattae BLCC-M143]